MSSIPSNVVPLRRGKRANCLASQLEASVRLAFVRGLNRRGWTIEQAARECASSPSAVVKWISGKRRIPGRALFVVLGIGASNDNREAA